MDESISSNKLILEEKKAAKLFLWLFYLFFFSYDLFYKFFYPIYTKDRNPGMPKEGIGLLYYILILAMLVFAVYFIKMNNPYIVKYIYVIGYVFVDTFNDTLIYIHSSKPFEAGNVVEVLFILFSPIFVSKKYYWTVYSFLIGRYAFLGIVLQDKHTLMPIIIYSVLSAVAFIILIRFYSYINSLKKSYEELRQKEKLVVVGQMAAAVGHEIRNPLASLKGFTQLQYERYPNTNDFYPIMIQEIDRINWIVNDLMYLGKPKSLQFEIASISEIISYTLSITEHQAEALNISIEFTIEEPELSIECDEKQLKQVLLNLLKNAIEAMPAGGVIDIKVNTIDKNIVLISIQDDGCGISKEHIENLGKAFYTTKKDGNGLGLMVSSQIVKDHNGQFKIDSEDGKGTRINILLPMKQ